MLGRTETKLNWSEVMIKIFSRVVLVVIEPVGQMYLFYTTLNLISLTW